MTMTITVTPTRSTNVSLPIGSSIAQGTDKACKQDAFVKLKFQSASMRSARLVREPTLITRRPLTRHGLAFSQPSEDLSTPPNFGGQYLGSDNYYIIIAKTTNGLAMADCQYQPIYETFYSQRSISGQICLFHQLLQIAVGLLDALAEHLGIELGTEE